MSLRDAAREMSKHRKFLTGLVALADAVEAAASAENALAEQTAALEVKRGELAAMQAQIDAAKAEADQVAAKAAQALEVAKAKAAEVVSDAQKAAASALEAANLKAGQIVADAQAKRDALVAEGAAAKEELKATRDRLASLATDVRGMVAQAVGA